MTDARGEHADAPGVSHSMSLPLRLPLAAALILGVVGCADPFSPGQSILLPIVSLEAPASVTGGQSFVVRVSIQSGGCQTFTGLDGTRTASRLVLTARGRDGSGPGISCPGDIQVNNLGYDRDGRITITQPHPYKGTVLMLFGMLDVGDA